MMKKIAALILVSVLLTGALFAEGQQQEKVTLRFATSIMTAGAGITTKLLLDEFQKENPNVTLTIEEYPGNDLITGINTAMTAGNPPDVFVFWRPEAGWNVPSYAKAGHLADLTELTKNPAIKDLFPEFAWKTAKQIDGIAYCIPRTSYYDEFIINKAVFEKNGIPLPTSWDKLISAIAALKAKGVIPWANTTGAMLDDSSRLFFNILNRVVGNAKALDLMEGRAKWTDPDVLPALQYFVAVAAGNGPPDQSVLSTNQVIAKYLNTGAAAMMLNNNGQINSNITAEAMPNMVTLEFPATPICVEPKSSTQADVTNLVYASAKSYKDPVKRAAIDKLIIKLVDKTAGKRYVEESKVTVPHLGLQIDEKFVPKFVIDADAVAQKQIGNKWLFSFVAQKNRTTIRDLVNEVWYGKITAEQFRDGLQNGVFGK